eukprot:jgi/Ulvmu1/9156/UM005_0254.1
MDSVLGVSLRFVSLGIWTFLIILAIYSPVYGVAWSVDAARPELVPFSLIITVILSFVCVSVPTALAWFLCQTVHEWGSLNSLVSKAWTRTPIWRPALAMKSASKLAASILLCVVTACLGALHIRYVCAISQQHQSTASLPPIWSLMPFGAVHALAYLIQSKHRISYPAVHMPRLQQLMNSAVPAIKAGVHIWARAAVLALVTTLFVFKPTLGFKQTLLAAITSFCFTLALSWSSCLVNILMAERLNRRGLQHVDHGVVLEMLIHRLHGLTDPPNSALTLQELSVRGGYYGISFWSEIFQDHSGTELWLPLASACLRELRGLTAATDQYLEAHGKTR